MDVWSKSAERFVSRVASTSGSLVAFVATRRGARLPIAWVQDVFLLGIADRLEAEGVSRKVAADMLGMSRRTYQRHVDAARAGAEARGQVTDWHRVLELLRQRSMTREELQVAMPRIQERRFASILADMVSNGLVLREGAEYRSAAPSESTAAERLRHAVAYMRKGVGVDLEEAAEQFDVDVDELSDALGDDIIHIVEADTALPSLTPLFAHSARWFEGIISGDYERFLGGFWELSLVDRSPDELAEIREETKRAREILTGLTRKFSNDEISPSGALWMATLQSVFEFED